MILVLCVITLLLLLCWFLKPSNVIASNEAICKKFDAVRTKSQCTYAHTAKTFGAPNWNSKLSIEDNLSSMIPSLLHFVSIARVEKIDGYLIEITDPSVGRTEEDVVETILTVVKFFGQLHRSTKDRNSFNTYIEKKAQGQKKWCDYGVTINNERLFITPFAPCYPETSSRYSFGLKHTFLLLQASWSFDMLNEKANGDWTKIIEARDKIRENFAKHGRPYAK
eukprot:TRINITY_DN4456_c0_g1_i2.p1 TRINITY_DN4456_c0_g1~~TRINITY_DN4456_c0_g1_i2.p1  ORF type:complete len:223 (+),score=40.24 TRINITY_DN4456_c0_g1_i2:7-675(+)